MPEGEKNERQSQNPTEQYSELLNIYQQASRAGKAIQKRYPVPGDPETTEKITNLDRKRHEIHLQLLEEGGKLGKNESDVLIDIIRRSRTLESYGLPEFSILKEDDIVATNDWHNPYYFNVDTTDRLPSDSSQDFSLKKQGENGIPNDRFILVFSIVPIVNDGEDELEPEDYQVRMGRAEKLAQELGGEIFEKRDSSYHEASAKILGVIFPKKEFEKIVDMIRNNAEKFRLGKEFYSKEEIAQIRLG